MTHQTVSFLTQLRLRIVPAEAMADLHGYEEGTMIHGDVQLVQWLRSETGSIKLNDFSKFNVTTKLHRHRK